MNDRDTDPKDRRSSENKAEKRADQGSGERSKDRPAPDATDYGQPAGSPGGRGGTTCYGGVKRMAPRNGAKDEPPAGR
ncbi:hypothetical protein J2847_003969 [Azospirillum agricola]|uniref:hypothetical protein n=1 Tax=Azospirillum agricola TaxID=1720247 RepID=UPI001AEAC9B7|nr:hypothetical protein [Azospirillum agricola]MBP2230664.1 hypothetical protein [Azospirillum agricola]